MALAIFSSLLRNMFMEFDRNAVSVAIPSIIHLAFHGNNRVLHSCNLEVVIMILQHSVENNADKFQVLEDLIALLTGGASSDTWICQ